MTRSKDKTDTNKGLIMDNVVRPEPGWKHRRRIIYGTLLFCAFCVLYIVIWGSDTRINETIITSSFMLGGTVIGMYVFGATYQDLSLLTKIQMPPKRKSEKTVLTE